MPQGLQKVIMWRIYVQKTRYNYRPLNTPPQGFDITLQVFPLGSFITFSGAHTPTDTQSCVYWLSAMLGVGGAGLWVRWSNRQEPGWSKSLGTRRELWDWYLESVYENRLKGQLCSPGLSPELGTGMPAGCQWVFCRLEKDEGPGGMGRWVAIRGKSRIELEGGDDWLEDWIRVRVGE